MYNFSVQRGSAITLINVEGPDCYAKQAYRVLVSMESGYVLGKL